MSFRRRERFIAWWLLSPGDPREPLARCRQFDASSPERARSREEADEEGRDFFGWWPMQILRAVIIGVAVAGAIVRLLLS